MTNDLSNTIEVEVATFRCRTDDDEYKAIAAEMKERGIEHFNVWHTRDDSAVEAGTYHIEKKHLFNNQSNTVEGFRVFDWYDGMPNMDNRKCRIGHYIKAGPGWDALMELRRNTNRCGYCGHEEAAAKGLVFCDRCIDSEYLTEKDLRMTRMRACSEGHAYTSPDLTEAERAHLIPLFKHAQLHGATERGKARMIKKREEIRVTYDKAIKNAETEFGGFSWLLDRVLLADNCIFYNHTGRFNFGWRKPYTDEEAAELRAQLADFKYPYDITKVGDKK